MIVIYPPKPGESIDKEEAINSACSHLITFATKGTKPKTRRLDHLDYEFFEFTTPQSHLKTVEGLAAKIGDKLKFRNYYNDQGKLTAVTVSNFAQFLPTDMSSWTFVDDNSEEFVGRIH